MSVLDSLVFKNITTDPTDSTNKPTRVVTFKVREVVPNVDSVGFWSDMTRTFTVVAVNRAPVLTDARTNKTATAITFTEAGAEVNIGDSFTLTDVVADTNVDSLVIRISGNAMGADSLFFTNTGTMTASYNYGANTGDSITLGAGSIKFDSMVVLLKNLRYKNTGTNPTGTNG